MNEPPTVDDVRVAMSGFDYFDYVVFAGTFLACVAFGIYYSLRGERSMDPAKEYLMGGRKMSTFPVATSLVASCLSGITLLRVPSEIYLHGTEYAFAIIPIFLTGLLSSYVLLPVFHEMRLLSTYEYLERRFDKSVRLFGSLMFLVGQIFWLPVVVFVPVLAFNQVTGMDIYTVTPCVCLICVLYTCLGGLKAVVWTDAFQTWLAVGSMILVCLKGSFDLGGFKEVWQRNYEGGRLVYPTFDGDLTIRHSFWAVTFGGLLMWIQWCVIDQKVLQRYLSLPSLSQARSALWIFVFGMIGLTLICSYAGLVIYAFYHDCDPLTTKLAKAKDQLLPLLVMRIFTNFPGLAGLFVAGIFSASLSSLSSGLNSLSAVFLEDFIKSFVKEDLHTTAVEVIMRGAVIFFGIFILLLVFILEKFGYILQLSLSLGSVTSGPVFGVFFSGVFLPWVNAKGALLGGLLGLFANGFVILGAQNAAAGNKIKSFPKPTSVEGCLYYYNATILVSSWENIEDGNAVFPLFKLSYFWYTAFGGFITIILALVISAFTGFTNLENVEPICFSPIIRGGLQTSDNLMKKEKLLIKQLKRNRTP